MVLNIQIIFIKQGQQIQIKKINIDLIIVQKIDLQMQVNMSVNILITNIKIKQIHQEEH